MCSECFSSHELNIYTVYQKPDEILGANDSSSSSLSQKRHSTLQGRQAQSDRELMADEWIDGQADGLTDGWTDGRIVRWMTGRKDRQTDRHEEQR